LWKEGFENPDTFAFAVASHGHPSSEWIGGAWFMVSSAGFNSRGDPLSIGQVQELETMVLLWISLPGVLGLSLKKKRQWAVHRMNCHYRKWK
jgi:hypothetical protein